jgi:hypothetical protein
MIRRLVISLACVAMTWSTSAEGQVRIQPGAEPLGLPGAPVPEFQAPRRFQRGTAVPRQTARPTPPAIAPQGPPAGPRQPMISAFVELPGLSEPIQHLLDDLGYEDGKTVPLTPHTTFDLAFACYVSGRYADAIVFATHGLRLCNDARLHLIKGVCQLHLGQAPAAEMTAVDYRNAIGAQQMFGLDVARERINDPWAVRFADVVEYQAVGR